MKIKTIAASFGIWDENRGDLIYQDDAPMIFATKQSAMDLVEMMDHGMFKVVVVYTGVKVE